MKRPSIPFSAIGKKRYTVDQSNLARTLRELDLLKRTDASLIHWLKALDQPHRGTREELIERLHCCIWLSCHD